MEGEVLGLYLDDLEAAILPRVSRPARYLPLILGLRERLPDALPAVLAAPDLFEAAFMHPVMPALYHGLFAAGAAPELAFVPWIDFEAELRRARLPLYALESRRPLNAFPLVVIPVLRELMATGVVELLDLGGIPIFAEERGPGDPIVVGAGPALANPEPFAPFFDAVLVGDTEASLAPAVAAIARFVRERGERGAEAATKDRRELWAALATIPGVYVPALVPVRPGPGGALVADSGESPVRLPIAAAYLPHPPAPVEPLQALIEVRSDHLELEVQRGCPRRCRFCQPARTAGPVFEVAPADVAAFAGRTVDRGGWEEVVVGGLMPPDWPELESGMSALGRRFLGTGVALAIGAAAGERMSKSVLVELARVRRTTLAFAPEAGSERLRRVIGKPLDEAALLAAVTEASGLGWPSVKLHFMIGLPTETDEDLVAIADLASRVAQGGQRPGGRFSVQVTIHPFVPRAQTPFQWEAQLSLDDMRRRVKRLRALLKRRALRLRWEQPEAAQIAALVSRGDRRLARAIVAAYRAGARLDDWTELMRPVLWWRSAAENGLDPARELGARDITVPLPWSHLALGEGEAHLRAERDRAHRGEITPPRPIAIAAIAADRRGLRGRRGPHAGHRPDG